jgi:hypothetical protein
MSIRQWEDSTKGRPASFATQTRPAVVSKGSEAIPGALVSRPQVKP